MDEEKPYSPSPAEVQRLRRLIRKLKNKAKGRAYGRGVNNDYPFNSENEEHETLSREAMLSLVGHNSRSFGMDE